MAKKKPEVTTGEPTPITLNEAQLERLFKIVKLKIDEKKAAEQAPAAEPTPTTEQE